MSRHGKGALLALIESGSGRMAEFGLEGRDADRQRETDRLMFRYTVFDANLDGIAADFADVDLHGGVSHWSAQSGSQKVRRHVNLKLRVQDHPDVFLVRRPWSALLVPLPVRRVAR